jgi:hypothetical protein
LTNSSGWAFPGWLGFSQWTKKEFGRFYKKERGVHVPDNELVRLALITFEECRPTNIHFDLFMAIRKYGWEGVFRMQNKEWRDILMGNKEGEELKTGGRCDSQGCKQLELWGGEIVEVLQY